MAGQGQFDEADQSAHPTHGAGPVDRLGEGWRLLGSPWLPLENAGKREASVRSGFPNCGKSRGWAVLTETSLGNLRARLHPHGPGEARVAIRAGCIFIGLFVPRPGWLPPKSRATPASRPIWRSRYITTEHLTCRPRIHAVGRDRTKASVASGLRTISEPEARPRDGPLRRPQGVSVRHDVDWKDDVASHTGSGVRNAVLPASPACGRGSSVCRPSEQFRCLAGSRA